MSEYEGFKEVDEMELTQQGNVWKAALKEFLDSGKRLVCKEYPTNEDAKKAASGFQGCYKDFNRWQSYEPLKEKNKDKEEFTFPTVEVHKAQNRVYLKRVNRLAKKNKKRGDKIEFPLGYQYHQMCEVVE